jgi:hypothetical protein
MVFNVTFNDILVISWQLVLLFGKQDSYKLRAYTEGDESPFSDPVSIVTEESGKSIIIEIN